jgi:RimJ/RimL family protein N-acetyltransferase
MTPVIQTSRLVLRAHELRDFDAYCALWADPELVRFIGGKIFSREACWSRFLRHAGHWQHMGFGYFAIEERGSGRFVGEAGFHDMRRDITPSLEGTLEAGWVLTREVQGRGYATEATEALVAWADDAFPGRRMTAIIEPANTASIRIAERLGFEVSGQGTYHGTPLTMFERRR